MPTLEAVAKQSREERLGCMARTPDDLAAAIRGHTDAALVRRPDELGARRGGAAPYLISSTS